MTTVAELFVGLEADIERLRRMPVPPPPMRRVAADTLPPPLFPPGLKLRDNDMPLPIDKFATSMAAAGHVAEAAALRLMSRAWRETPVGTLPSDDRLLRELAGLDRRAWKTLMCSDGRLHCWLLLEVVARLVSIRAAKRAQSASNRGAEWAHFANWFADRSRGYAKTGHPDGWDKVPTRPDSFLPSIKQSVLLPRARETDPTPTRLQDASQGHEPEVATALPDNWHPAPADIEAVKAARPDLDDVAIERQRRRFVGKARGTATAAEWARRFVAFGKGGHGKPWNAAPSSNGQDRPAANGHARTSEPDELLQWRARLKDWRPGKLWLPTWGPKPGEKGCHAPRALLLELGFEREGD